MRIARIESFHADAGWRTFDYLKVTTDDGLVGWSEYNESFGGAGISSLIDRLAPALIGKDPRPYEAHTALLQTLRRAAQGSAFQQAIGAIENALLDLKARALGIPVYELLGGPVRDRIRLYWSHFGTWRVDGRAEVLGLPPLTSLDDLAAAARAVVAQGYTALKTNLLLFEGGKARSHVPGFAPAAGFPELNADRHLLAAIRAQLGTIRDAVGPGVDIMVDLNFNYKTEGYLQLVRAMEPFDLTWVEIDTRDPAALAHIRQQSRLPIASLETLASRREFRPFLERNAVDVAIVDVPWNGLGESIKIAALADAHEVNVAPHNFYSHLATLMSAHFAAVVPNLRIMETDPETVPWQDELTTARPDVRDGYLYLPTGPGWGAEVDEAAVRAHPPRR
jgi:L-alanine-DL-glutamate epimerase-like enolase superfamily enzyme